LRPKSKMKNEYLFAKNFAWCLVPFYKMVDQNPNFGIQMFLLKFMKYSRYLDCNRYTNVGKVNK
jgi:hypothetical protein